MPQLALALYSLTDAHGHLSTVVGEATAQYECDGRYSIGDDVRAAMSRFVGNLVRLPGAEAELQRRAACLEASCQRRSTYRLAKAAVIRLLRRKQNDDMEKKLCAKFRHIMPWLGEATIEKCAQHVTDRQPRHEKVTARAHILRVRRQRGPVSLAHVVEVYEEVNSALREGVVTNEDRPTFEAWRDELGRLREEADDVKSDGCHWLWHVHRGGQAGASEYSRFARDLIENGVTGGAHLPDIRAAVHSLHDWASDNPPGETEGPAGGESLGKRRPGRKLQYNAGEDARLASHWVIARNRGTSKVAFAWARGMSQRELDRLLSRVRGRRGRAK